MSKEITADDIYDQIDKEAKAIAKKVTRYDPDEDESLGQYKPKRVEYDKIVRWYKAGAGQYAEKLERYEKALNAIENMSEDQGREGCTWGDTKYDSLSAVAGYNQALDSVKSIVRKTLTHKPTTDDTE